MSERALDDDDDERRTTRNDDESVAIPTRRPHDRARRAGAGGSGEEQIRAAMKAMSVLTAVLQVTEGSEEGVLAKLAAAKKAHDQSAQDQRAQGEPVGTSR